jgi:hypothetical protein
LLGVLLLIVWYSDVVLGTHYFQAIHGLLPSSGVY